MGRNARLLAFVHIEKAAGTTLNHILRRNFFPCYMEDYAPRKFYNDPMIGALRVCAGLPYKTFMGYEYESCPSNDRKG